MPFEIPSSRAARSSERPDSAVAVKYDTALSRAELTLRPVESRVWVRSFSAAVDWRLMRLARTPADSVICEAMGIPFLE